MKASRKGRRGVAEFAEFTRAKDGTVIIQQLIQFRKINLQSLNQEECVIMGNFNCSPKTHPDAFKQFETDKFKKRNFFIG